MLLKIGEEVINVSKYKRCIIVGMNSNQIQIEYIPKIWHGCWYDDSIHISDIRKLTKLDKVLK